MKQDLVSVIVPVYNVYEFLVESIVSIKSQDYHNNEIIVVNDGSNKNSSRAIENICSNYTKVKLITEKVNKGASQARAAGLKHARGKYIIFLDADDVLTENAISSLVAILENKKKYIASYGTKTKLMASGEVHYKLPTQEQSVTGDVLPSLLKGVPLLSNGNICIKKEYIDKVDFPEVITHGEDWITWCRLALLGEMIFTENLVLKIRSHEHNVSNLTHKKPSLLYNMLDSVFRDKKFIRRFGAETINQYYKTHRAHINKYLYYTFKNRGQFIMALKQRLLGIFWKIKIK